MNATPKNFTVRYKIRDLVLDSGSRRVTRNGKVLKLGGLTFDLLQALAEASPSIMNYEALADRVWQGRAVSPETLAQRAKMLREALSDDATSPRYFAVVRGQGYRLVADVEVLDHETRSKSARPWLPAVTVILAAIAVYFAFHSQLGDDGELPSVAVLPFTDMSQAGDQGFLADGFAEELINQLARLDGLDVASRTESFYFREKSGDLREIGRKLGVAAIIEGSIRRSDDNIRITVQVIDVESGYHLWSKNFDRQLGDIFALQDEIASAVAGALGVQLGVGAVNAFPGAGTRNFDAYEAYLKGDFVGALQIDPEYAAAWGAEGVRIASTMWRNPPEGVPDIVERAYRHVAQAVELDPQSSQARTDFATITYVSAAWNEAEESYTQALSLRRNTYSLGHYANMLMRTGRSTRSREIHREREDMLRLPEQHPALRINVDIALGRLDLARQRAAIMGAEASRFTMLTIALNEDSLDNIQAAIDELPRNTPDYRELFGPIRDMLESRDTALSFLKELAGNSQIWWPHKYVEIALVAAYLGDPELALSVFESELYDTRIRYGALWFPVMADVRRLPKFKSFVIEVNLVDYWKRHGWPDFCGPRGEEDFVCR